MYLDCSLFSIVIKSIQPDCDKIKGISVLLLETPLTRSKYIFPIHTRTTSYANFKNLLHIRGNQTIKLPLQHLEGASSDLVRSMFQVGQKAAELERTKLESEIQKEKSELRRKRFEKNLKMSGKAGGKGGPAKNPKKMKREPDDDDDNDFLDDLVVDTETDKRQPSYSM